MKFISSTNDIRKYLGLKPEKNIKFKNNFIFLPDKLFIFLITPIFVLSRKNHEALLRIFANLSHFTQHHELTNNRSKCFPNNNI